MSRIEVNSLEVPVTQHCNLRCAACDHAAPHLGAGYLDIDELAADLEALQPCMHAYEFRLVGGEPLQHPRLYEIIKTVRQSGIAERIVLVTNGAILFRAGAEIWRSIDTLWLSIYPGVRLRPSLSEIELLCQEHDVVLDSRPIGSFRRTLLNRPNEDRDLVQHIYRACKMAHEWKCYTVSGGRFYKCTPPSIPRHGLTPQRADDHQRLGDGVDLHPTSSLGERLQHYLDSTMPLDACRFCLGTSGPEISHSQLNRKGLEAERASDNISDLEYVKANSQADDPTAAPFQERR